MFLRASDNPSGLYTPACALSQTPAERHAALTEAQTRSSSTQLPSQVARPPATLTYFFIYVESRDIFGFLSPVILLLYFFTIPSNTSTWSCGAEVKWRLKRWATKSNSSFKVVPWLHTDTQRTWIKLHRAELTSFTSLLL